MPPRSIYPGRRKPSTLLGPDAAYQLPLEIFSDETGSVVVGWIGQGVLYARFSGVLSVALGAKHNARLEAAIVHTPSLRYFSDASALSSYDLVARSAFVRLLLAHRLKFAQLVMLTWAEGVSPAGQSYAAVVGEPIEVLTDREEFETALLRAAPFAKRKLDPKTWKGELSPRLPR